MKRLFLLITVLAFNLSNAQYESKGFYYGTSKVYPESPTSVKAVAGASLYLTGIGNVKSRAMFQGAEAKTKVHVDSLTFIANFGIQEVDDFATKSAANTITNPNDFQLHVLTIKRNSRRLQIGNLGTFSGSNMGLDPELSIPFTFNEISPGIFEISINKEDLGKTWLDGKTQPINGQYAFCTSVWYDTSKIWSFEIYGSEKKSNVKETPRNKKKRPGQRN